MPGRVANFCALRRVGLTPTRNHKAHLRAESTCPENARTIGLAMKHRPGVYARPGIHTSDAIMTATAAMTIAQTATRAHSGRRAAGNRRISWSCCSRRSRARRLRDPGDRSSLTAPDG